MKGIKNKLFLVTGKGLELLKHTASALRKNFIFMAGKVWEYLKRLLKSLWAVAARFLRGIFRILKLIAGGIGFVLQKIWTVLNIGKFEPRRRRYFFINIGIGLVIVCLMHVVERTQWGENTLNGVFDIFIRMGANRAVKDTAKPVDLLLVDLDNKKKENNDHEVRLLSSRADIAAVIQRAAAGGAQIVVLDILLETKDCCLPEEEQILENALKTYPKDEDFKTKVIFVVRVDKDGSLKKHRYDWLIETNPNFYRAIPDFYTSSSDSVARYWKAYERFGKKGILWSIPVLTFALAEGRIDELKKLELQLVQPGKTDKIVEIKAQKTKNRVFRLPLSDDDLYLQRIQYRLIPRDCLEHKPAGNLIQPSLKTLRAGRCKDKILVVGTSDPDKGDIFPTPVGMMPGMYIHGNSLFTLLEGYQPRPAALWAIYSLELLMVIGAAYFFLYLNSFFAKFAGTFFIIGVFGVLSYVVFFEYYGVFLNFVFGLAGIGYLETLATLRELISQKSITNQ